MKKITMFAGAAISLVTIVSAVALTKNDPSIINNAAGEPGTYKHYNAIAPTDDGHGCREFWVNCSDYSYSFTAPTEGTITEGGNITDNPSFDWDGMDVTDERFIPSINQQKAWGMIPVVENNKVTYGLYPQTHVSDADTIAALEALPTSSGYYYYNGNYYQTCIADRCDKDSHFADGTMVDGDKYWFLCEPISWVIMENSGSTYKLYSEKAIHAGITWGYSDSSVYQTSQVREWLNGIGTHDGNGFLQSAFFNNEYLQKMSLTLDDGSAALNDYVRLLTKDEADTTYFANDNARKVVLTDWAGAHHAMYSSISSLYGRWWLCEANTDTTTNAWGVGLGGTVGGGGPKTGNDSRDRAERPVITINID